MITPQNPCQDIEISALMPLISRIMCHARQQASLTYKDLGYDLSPETVDTLMTIHHLDGLSQSQLADILGKDKAAVTRILNTLVKNNLVERVQDLDDRRIIRANITEEGKKAFITIAPKLKELSCHILNNVDIKDFDTTLSVLTQIIDNMYYLPSRKL